MEANAERLRRKPSPMPWSAVARSPGAESALLASPSAGARPLFLRHLCKNAEAVISHLAASCAESEPLSFGAGPIWRTEFVCSGEAKQAGQLTSLENDDILK